MFQSVLKPTWVPRGRIANGVAFAVAVHAWLLVPLLARPAPHRAHESPRPEIELFLAPSPNPPPLGQGGPPPKSSAPARSQARAPTPLRPPTPDARPAASAAPADSAPPDSTDAVGSVTGAPVGGSLDGVIGGTGTGDPNGVPGGTGTGTGRAAAPPPTYLTMHVGDPALDQSTCQISGQPPYPKEAIAQKVEGVVLTRCTVEPGGSLSGCQILKAPYSFDAPVKAFLATAHARPFTASGKPVRVQCNFSFRYKLE